MGNIINFFVALGKCANNKLLCFILVILTVLAAWIGIHIEMWLYEEIVIKAMGTNLNPLSFWEMVGLDFLCGMLTGSSNSVSVKED